MSKRRTIIAIMFLTALAGTVSAQQLTTVAIIDAQYVYDMFVKESSTTGSVEALRNTYQAEIELTRDEISELHALRRQAISERRESDVEAIEEQILSAQNRIDDLIDERNDAITARRQILLPQNFIPELQRAIVFVAESEGYTVVLRAEDESLQWWSPAVDISDSVVDRLMTQIDR